MTKGRVGGHMHIAGQCMAGEVGGTMGVVTRDGWRRGWGRGGSD